MSTVKLMKKPSTSTSFQSQKKRSIAWRSVTFLARTLAAVLLFPFRAIAALRRSVTTASVGLMLLSLMALNIVWGYPWVGMLATCLSLLAIGWIINRLTRPKLQAGCSLPSHAAVGQAFSLTCHFSNARGLPALDVATGFDARPDDRKRRLPGDSLVTESSPWQFFPLIRSGDAVDHEASLTYSRRGVHDLPPLVVQSTFPFYLFRNRSNANFRETIAITPAPLDTAADFVAKNLLSSIGNWAQKALAGAAMEYAGSREYQVGMPVRRWDFTSWARLGKPIVREFQSPSVRRLTMVVDTSADHVDSENASESFEYLLSLTMTAIQEFAANSIRLELYLTNEPSQRLTDPGFNDPAPEHDGMLIRLASAEQVQKNVADTRIEEALESLGPATTVLLTRRDQSVDRFSDQVTIIRVAPDSHFTPDSNFVQDNSFTPDNQSAPNTQSFQEAR